jgi:hypothetical protein
MNRDSGEELGRCSLRKILLLHFSINASFIHDIAAAESMMCGLGSLYLFDCNHRFWVEIGRWVSVASREKLQRDRPHRHTPSALFSDRTKPPTASEQGQS